MTTKPPLDELPWQNLPWVQHEITNWADATFGADRSVYMALSKMVLEEIPEMLEHKKVHGIKGLGPELADIAILLFDIATMCKVDLAQAVQNKMAINYRRTWARDPHAQGTFQHVVEDK